MQRYYWIFLTVFFWTSALSISGQSPIQTQNQAATSAGIATVTDTRGYLIGIGDEIEIKVLGEADFGGTFTVDEDGRIQLPFVETPLAASCRTDRELRGEVTALLKKNVLKDPQVNVRVTEKRSRPPAVIYGEVRQPQQFDLRRDAKLLELLSLTGGVTEQASGLVEIIHTRPTQCAEPGVPAAIAQVADEGAKIPSQVYNLENVKNGRFDANPIIRPGDVINVLKSAPVYMVGEVRSPQGVYIPDRGLTLTDAVAMVGGLNPQAKKKDVRIYRLIKGSTERETILANLDLIKKGEQKNLVLQPYDVVEINKAPQSVGQIMLGIATGAVQTAGTSLGGSVTRVLY